MTEMEALVDQRHKDDDMWSKESYARFVRDEQAWLDRRASLQRKCDREAADGMQHYHEMQNDISKKTDRYNQRI
jgi:hypothetical protein